MNKNKKKPTKTLSKKLTAIMAAATLFMTPAHAAGILDSKIVKGITNLVNDLSTVCVALCPTIAVLVFIYCMARKAASEDETDGKMWKKRGANALICGLAGMLGSAIFALISSYFI